jgi:hypothetical protein
MAGLLAHNFPHVLARKTADTVTVIDELWPAADSRHQTEINSITRVQTTV